MSNSSYDTQQSTIQNLISLREYIIEISNNIRNIKLKNQNLLLSSAKLLRARSLASLDRIESIKSRLNKLTETSRKITINDIYEQYRRRYNINNVNNKSSYRLSTIKEEEGQVLLSQSEVLKQKLIKKVVFLVLLHNLNGKLTHVYINVYARIFIIVIAISPYYAPMLAELHTLIYMLYVCIRYSEESL